MLIVYTHLAYIGSYVIASEDFNIILYFYTIAIMKIATIAKSISQSTFLWVHVAF